MTLFWLICKVGGTQAQKGTTLGIVTTSSETTFEQSARTIYDFVSNPANWTKTYPGRPRASAICRTVFRSRSATPGTKALPIRRRDQVYPRGSLPIAHASDLFVFRSVRAPGARQPGQRRAEKAG